MKTDFKKERESLEKELNQFSPIVKFHKENPNVKIVIEHSKSENNPLYVWLIKDDGVSEKGNIPLNSVIY